MTAKSIIQVAVEDSQFRAFYELYREYQTHLESMPEDWKATGEAINDAGGAAKEFAEATGNSQEAMAIAATQAEIISKEIRKSAEVNKVLLEGIWKNTRAQKDFSDEAERSNESLKKRKQNAEGVAGSVFGIGKWLLKLGAWGAGLAGLGGLLSGIGLKDLAESAVNTQRSARGLGMTPGQLTAFNQDYGRYIDQGTLGSIANAQNSYAGQVWLARASGETVKQVSSEDPGQLAGRLAIRAHDWWVNTPESMRTSEALQATGFTQAGFSLSMMRQMGNTPLSELQRASSQYGQDQSRFNVSDRNTDAWYGFLRQIKDAGNTIEADLKNKLVALAPNLEHFISVIGKDAMKLIDNIFTPKNLQSLEDGIDKLTDYLGSKQFGQDIKAFADAIGEIAGDAKQLASSLNKILHPFGGGDSTPDQNKPSLGVDAATGGLDAPLFGGDDASAANARMAGFASTVRGGSGAAAKSVWGWISDYLTGKDNAAIGDRFARSGDDIESALSGATPDLIAAQALTESSGNPNAKSSAGAKGLMQITDETANMLGLKNAFDPVQSIGAAVKYDNLLLKKYSGDVRKMLAAYNWGPGNLDKDIAKNGANWEQHLPAETRAYLNKIAAALRQKPGFTVTVNNNTSARVAVQANAAAAQ